MPSADEQNEVFDLLMAETEEFNQMMIMQLRSAVLYG